MRKPWPRITVVTPSFNQAPFLEETLRSVLLQGYPNLEYIVIDGASTDGSIEILSRYSPSLSYWVSERDHGQAHAINKGLHRATGEIVAWLNSDDLLLPGSLFRVAEQFLENSDCRVVTGLRKVIDADGRHRRNWFRDLPIPRYLRRYCCVAQETVFWHREVLDTIGLLDDSFHYALDYEYWLRMLEHGYRLDLIPYYLGAFREHATSKTSTQHETFERESRELFQRYSLGRNREEVLSQLGETWNVRLAMLEDLCQTRLFDHPRTAVSFLHWLERPGRTDKAVAIYRRYRVHRPRFSRRGGRWRSLFRALVEEMRGGPIFDVHEPHLFPANPLARPKWTSAEAAEADPQTLPLDALAVGEGWSWVEKTAALSYRWANNNAEILILRPSGTRRRLVMHLETGPSLDWQPFDLAVVDEDDVVIARRQVEPKETWILELDLDPDPDRSFRCLRLRVPSTDKPASGEDPRVLNFRLVGLCWDEDSRRHDLPVTVARTLEVALDTPDIIPSASIKRLQAGRLQRRIPSDGLFLGRGWFRPEALNDGLSRRAIGECEVVVTLSSRSVCVVEFDVREFGDHDGDAFEPEAVEISVWRDGRLLQRLDGAVGLLRFELPIGVGETVSFRWQLATRQDGKAASWRIGAVRILDG